MPTGIYEHKASPIEGRFWSKVNKTTKGCWLWTSVIDRYGYGMFRMGGQLSKYARAHRVAYEFVVGPIPDGLQIDHLCRNRACVNPAHMEPVTSRVNTLRGNGFPSQQRARTHCPQGHPYDLFNTYLHPDGSRKCRSCRRAKPSTMK